MAWSYNGMVDWNRPISDIRKPEHTAKKQSTGTFRKPEKAPEYVAAAHIRHLTTNARGVEFFLVCVKVALSTRVLASRAMYTRYSEGVMPILTRDTL